LPPKWGLIEVGDGGRTRVTRIPERFLEINTDAEMSLLLAVIRRFRACDTPMISIRQYTFESESPKMSVTFADDGEDPTTITPASGVDWRER
jgi:hypothetical protein